LQIAKWSQNLEIIRQFENCNRKCLELRSLGQLLVEFLSFFQYFQQTDNSYTTNVFSISKDVPQESILGPLLFLLYVNDFPNYLTSSSTVRFTDDTSILLTHSNLNTIYHQANEDLKNVDI